MYGLTGLASGRDGPVPYKTIVDRWMEFTREEYFPPKLTLKEPSKYLTEESNSILKLWRQRQANGQLAFKFDFFVGADNVPTEPEYSVGMFGLTAATAATASPDVPLVFICDEDEDEEEEVPLKKRKAAWSDDEQDEDSDITEKESGVGEWNARDAEKPIEDEVEVTPRITRRGRSQGNLRKVVESEDSDGQPPTPLGTPHAPHATSNTNFNTNRQSSRQIKNSKRASTQRQPLPTPEPSQASAMTAGTRQLRAATKLATENSKGKSEGSSRKSGNRKNVI